MGEPTNRSTRSSPPRSQLLPATASTAAVGAVALAFAVAGVDDVEVMATLCFAPVFVAALLWGRPAGYAAAGLCTLAYLGLRLGDIEDSGLLRVVLLVLARAGCYAVVAHATPSLQRRFPALASEADRREALPRHAAAALVRQTEEAGWAEPPPVTVVGHDAEQAARAGAESSWDQAGPGAGPWAASAGSPHRWDAPPAEGAEQPWATSVGVADRWEGPPGGSPEGWGEPPAEGAEPWAAAAGPPEGWGEPPGGSPDRWEGPPAESPERWDAPPAESPESWGGPPDSWEGPPEGWGEPPAEGAEPWAAASGGSPERWDAPPGEAPEPWVASEPTDRWDPPPPPPDPWTMPAEPAGAAAYFAGNGGWPPPAPTEAGPPSDPVPTEAAAPAWGDWEEPRPATTPTFQPPPAPTVPTGWVDDATVPLGDASIPLGYTGELFLPRDLDHSPANGATNGSGHPAPFPAADGGFPAPGAPPPPAAVEPPAPPPPDPGFSTGSYDLGEPPPAGVDPETRLWNARSFRDRLTAAHEQATRSGGPFSVVMVQVPDEPFQTLPYRRQVALLRELGHQFTQARMIDHLVHLPDGAQHWFAVVLPGVDRTGAHSLERRLRGAIAAYLRSRGLQLGEVQSASLTSPDDDEAMGAVWASLLGQTSVG